MAGGWNGMSFEVPSHSTLISKVFVLPSPLSFNGINSNFFIQIHLFHFPLDLKHLFSWCFFPKNETTHLPFTFQMEVSSHVTPQNTTSTQHNTEGKSFLFLPFPATAKAYPSAESELIVPPKVLTGEKQPKCPVWRGGSVCWAYPDHLNCERKLQGCIQFALKTNKYPLELVGMIRK